MGIKDYMWWMEREEVACLHPANLMLKLGKLFSAVRASIPAMNDSQQGLN